MPATTCGSPKRCWRTANVIMGLGDGGAHVGFILDAGFPTWLMTYWQKERQRFSIGETIRRLTSDTAEAAGCLTAEIIRPGMKADIKRHRLRPPFLQQAYVAYDLPTGAKRLLQKADGYDVTIVSGSVTYRNGEATGALPGRVINGQQRWATPDSGRVVRPRQETKPRQLANTAAT